MRIAVIGGGNVGGGLGRICAAAGHEVCVGSREPHGPRSVALTERLGPNVAVLSIEEAAAAAEIVLLAVPWSAAEGTVKRADLAGKVLIDTTNPMGPGLELAVGHTTSAAERIAGWVPEARVVKAFNIVGAEHLSDPRLGGQALTMLICGDDQEAKTAVGSLAEEIGFEVVDAGPLTCARLLEPLAVLWIRLAVVEGLGRDIGFKLLRGKSR